MARMQVTMQERAEDLRTLRSDVKALDRRVESDALAARSAAHPLRGPAGARGDDLAHRPRPHRRRDHARPRGAGGQPLQSAQPPARPRHRAAALRPGPGGVELDDAYLGGKRGRGAPGKTPFVAAVETREEGPRGG